MNKPVNLNAVKYAALFLIEAHKTTTTLDVKNLLREHGFQANQSEVSQLMEIAAEELPLEFTISHINLHRIYELPSTPQLVVTPTNTVPPTYNHITKYWYYEKRDGDSIALTAEKNPRITNWQVSSTQNGLVVYSNYDANTRDDVRQAYASMFNVSFHSTRACLAKDGD